MVCSIESPELPTRTHVEFVKESIKSPSSCTSDTLNLLQRLLRTPADGQHHDEGQQENTRASRKTAGGGSRKAAKTMQPKVAAKVAVFQKSAEADPQSLSNKAKLALATEVFNIASKSLSDYLKSGPKARLSGGVDSVGNTTPRKGPSGRALQPMSPNPRSPKKSKSIHTPNERRKRECGIVEVVNCARLALESLRDLRCTQDNGASQFNIQLEQGACVLIGKIISLGLGDIAVTELRKLKQRIQKHLEDGIAPRSKRKPPKESKDTIVDLIRLDRTDLTTEVANIFIAFQAHILKLISINENPSTVHAVAELLQLSNASSPANIVIEAFKKGYIQTEKASQQLQSLSQAVLSLSLVTSGQSDKKSASRSRVKPLVAVNLQILSLELRCTWWKISGHQCDIVKELWSPLSRYVTTFARRCATIEKDDYEVVHKAFLRLESIVTASGYSFKGAHSAKCTAISTVMRTLGQLAQIAECIPDARKFYASCMSALPPDQPLLQAICRCKVALLELDALQTSKSSSHSPVSTAISEAGECLAVPLKGTQSDLDELVMEAAKLKKRAMAFLSMLGEDAQLDEDKAGESYICIVSYLYSFIRFLNRYLGEQTPSAEDNAPPVSEPLLKSKNIVLTAIESAAAVGKLSLIAERPSWAETEQLLLEALTLLSHFQNLGQLHCEPAILENISAMHMRLSNLYWSRYLKRKDHCQSRRELVHLLKQSAKLMGACLASDKLKGFAAVKLERLAGLYSDVDKTAKSVETYEAAINAHLETGALDTLSREARRASLFRILSDNSGTAFLFCRVLGQLVKMKSKTFCANDGLVYDDMTLDSEQRAVLLECQVSVLMDLANSKPSTGLTQAVQCSVRRLLALYVSRSYPIRRSRIIIQTLRFLSKSQIEFDRELTESLLSEAEHISLSGFPSFAEDSGLSTYAVSTLASLRLSRGFSIGNLPTTDTECIVNSWVLTARLCENWGSFLSSVDDPEAWISQMQLMVGYLEIRNLWKLRIAVLSSLQRVLDVQDCKDRSSLLTCISQLGAQYNRLGYSEKAGSVFARGELLVDKVELSASAQITWQLAYASYFMDIGNFDKAVAIMALAQAKFEEHADNVPKGTFQIRTAWERLVADAACMQSRLHLSTGALDQAIFFAKSAVKLNSRIWSRLDKSAGKKQDRVPAESTDSDVEMISNGLNTLSLVSGTTENTSNFLDGSVYWPHFASNYSALSHLSNLSAHNGMFQDAIYFGEQALKLAKSVGASSCCAFTQAKLGAQWVRGGHGEKGQESLNLAIAGAKGIAHSFDMSMFNADVSTIYRYQGNREAESRYIDLATRILLEVTSNDFVGPLDPFHREDELESKMDKLSIEPKGRSARAPKAATSRPKRVQRATKCDMKATSVYTANPESVMAFPLLSRFHAELIRLQARSKLLLQGNDDVLDLLDEAEKLPRSKATCVSQRIDRAECLVATFLQKLTTHGVYCVLPESTIAIPSVYPTDAASEEKAHASSSRGKKLPSSTRWGKATVRSSNAPSGNAADDFSGAIITANNLLTDVLSSAVLLGPTHECHRLSHLLAKASMIYNTTVKTGGPSRPHLPAFVIEQGRNSAFLREDSSIRADKMLGGPLEPLKWPAIPDSAEASEIAINSDFAKDYVDILPSSWNVITLTISADRKEFVISKLRAGHAPFTIRLPLKRGDAEHADEEEFGFEEGKAELLEIIKEANFSAHDSRARVDKASKKEWWANREALDTRLKNLVHNIEAVWFGGFRGVFSGKLTDSDHLSRFVSSFEKILDKHLPSRGKRGRSASPRPRIHREVMELFVNIGDIDSEEDPEDLIMDLLYFVVDILQFNGERNAYDEVDFDMMVVETLDAIRSYNEAERSQRTSCEGHHTILILDKEFHSFPWESLDCLRTSSVTRMPSLKRLQESILELRSKVRESETRQGISIDQRKGSYILNPSGDLKSTQKKFEGPLSALKDWSGIVNREPSEDEFKGALENKDLLLYFGHGSGAQYIRGRTIKRLERCAVTFLMGCSSGTLTEAGEFEAYGTPMNYMHAGTSALVATLWDVTDKDIDRFAQATFEKWGLLERNCASEEPAETNRMSKSKRLRRGQQSADASEGTESVVGLDTAVAESRDACILKYLNGAAPVVYGIPVFLG